MRFRDWLYISDELPTPEGEVVGESRVQEDERDACVVDQLRGGLARFLIDRIHHDQINLLGNEALDLAGFRRDASRRIEENQIDVLLGRFDLHGVDDNDQVRRLEADQRDAHDLFVISGCGIGEAEIGEGRGAEQGDSSQRRVPSFTYPMKCGNVTQAVSANINSIYSMVILESGKL